MAKENQQVEPETKIKLKRIAGFNNLNQSQIKDVLDSCGQWINNFNNLSPEHAIVVGNWFVEGFKESKFDLEKAEKILSGETPYKEEEPFLFISDLVNFAEQVRTSITGQQIALNYLQRQELDGLGSIFKVAGVDTDGNKITLKDLLKLEDFNNTKLIVKQIEKIKLILKPSIEVEKEKEELAGEETEEKDKKLPDIKKSTPQTQEEGEETSGDESEEEKEELKQETLKKYPSPTKLSELTPESRLYVQSLSIITINQALNRYFNAETLEKLGLPPNIRITFDQLPLETRRQLMDRAFVQVENLLLGGQYSIENLIKNPSQRIAFSSQTALGLITDLRGLNLLNQAVREILQNSNKEEKIAQNEKVQLSEKDLRQQIKNERENVLSNQAAEELFEKASSNKNINNVIGNMELYFNAVGNEAQLDQELVKRLQKILPDREPNKLNEAIGNIIPFIDLFIQQQLPPEYIIPDPKNFDYNRFINIFGKTLDEKEFNEHREELANLIVFYWKRKRAIWARDIRQEFSIEKYTPEQAQELFEEIQKNPNLQQRVRDLALINRQYDSTQIATAHANGQNTNIKEFDEFQQYQKDLINKYLQEQLAKLDQENQQQTIKVYFEYYQPGLEIESYTIEIFNQQIVPQITPMDFYALQAASVYGPGSFRRDGSGFVQEAFQKSQDLGENFANSALGQAANSLAAEALGDAMYLIPGFGEGLMALEAANPLVKEIKNEAIKKVLEKIEKNWLLILPALILSALLALFNSLILLLPILMAAAGAYLAFRNGLAGLQKFASGTQTVFKNIGDIFGTNKASLPSSAAVKQAKIIESNAGIAGKTVAGKLSPAMATAGKAVITTAVATGALGYIYQANLNSSFLTHFPSNESGLINSVEKTSKYAKMTKAAKITKGCKNLENNGAKCEDPFFPVSIEYTITIEPKEDFAIQITDINDKAEFRQSQTGWEEAGKTMPTIENSRELNFDYFKKIIGEQGGLSNNTLSENENQSYEESLIEDNIDSKIEENIVILPGKKLEFTYSMEDLSDSYNHTAIVNTIEANFIYKNDFMSGSDNMITAARICLGNCSAGAGCWPATGQISQLPYGGFTHSKPPGLSFMDAYDIACSYCTKADLYGPNVYVPFDGELCYMGCKKSEGCYYVLTFKNEGEDQKLNFLHFWEANADFSTAGTCMQVEAGYLIGPMGTNGFSTGVHLHYGASHGGAFYFQSNPGFSILEELTPEDNDGNQPALLNNYVTTCYEQ